MADIDHPLFPVFRAYATFGDRSATSLDTAKFAKMARESGLLDGRLDKTQVDLIFTKAKPKTERRLSFPDFLVAINMLAAIKYPNTNEQVARRLVSDRILDAACSMENNPRADVGGGIFAKLTDSRLYTGAHKHRFDVGGQGRGLAGRDSVGKGGEMGYAKVSADCNVSSLSQICRSNLSTGGTHLSTGGPGSGAAVRRSSVASTTSAHSSGTGPYTGPRTAGVMKPTISMAIKAQTTTGHGQGR